MECGATSSDRACLAGSRDYQWWCVNDKAVYTPYVILLVLLVPKLCFTAIKLRKNYDKANTYVDKSPLTPPFFKGGN
jgi:hypothetical protein